MRSYIFVLFLAICCFAVYANAAALPATPNDVDGPVQDSQDNVVPEPNLDGPVQEAPNNGVIGNVPEHNGPKTVPEARTKFLLLPLLFPDQFYF